MQMSRQALVGGARSSGGAFAVTATIGAGESGSASAASALTLVGGFWAGIAARTKGDFNDDGHVDLMFRRTSDGVSQLDAWMMQGVRRVGLPVPYSPAPPAALQVVGADDFGGDEQTDVVLQDPATGALEFWLLDGTIRTGSPTVLAGMGPEWELAATADFDRNGWPDLLWRNLTTQQLRIWRMHQTTPIPGGVVMPSPAQAVNSNWRVAAALDYSGDAFVDLLWYNITTGKIVLWFMDGNVARLSGNFTTPESAANLNTWKVSAGGDFGTGPSGQPVGAHDIVWQNAGSGNVVTWLMDFNRARVTGLFVEPGPGSNAWTVVGPR